MCHGAERSRSLGLAAMFKRNGQSCKNLLKDLSNRDAIALELGKDGKLPLRACQWVRASLQLFLSIWVFVTQGCDCILRHVACAAGT